METCCLGGFLAQVNTTTTMSRDASLEPVASSASSDYMAYCSQPVAYVEHTPNPLLPHFGLPEEEQNPLPQPAATRHSNMGGTNNSTAAEWHSHDSLDLIDKRRDTDNSCVEPDGGLAQSLLSPSDQMVLDVKAEDTAAEGVAAEDTVCSVCLEDTLGACVCVVDTDYHSQSR